MRLSLLYRRVYNERMMKRIQKSLQSALTALLAIGALALCMPASPARAHAAQGTFENPSLTVTAQVQTTGSMHVVEHRTFAFDGQFDVLRWAFTGLPADAEVSVAQVRAAQADKAGNIAGDWVTLAPTSFDSEWRQAVKGSGGNMAERFRDATGDDAPAFPAANSWALDERQRALYVFFQQTGAHMLFEVDYTVSDAVAAFDDVAEMYWDYVPARDDALTSNVIATVQLPVPKGAAVEPNETVLAWGHGADGQFDIGFDGTVSYTVPAVPAGQYANAHILFPVSWLPNLTVEAKQAHTGPRADAARAEEEAWTDTWSSGVVNTLGMNIAVLAACALALAAAGAAYLLLGREKRRDQLPALTTDEMQAVLHDPEVLARFRAWNHVAPTEADPEAVSERVRAAELFDPRSFKVQKVLAIAALVLLALAVVAAWAFGNWLTCGAFAATGICVGVVANYLPRRTPKGTALAVALGADEPAGPTSGAAASPNAGPTGSTNAHPAPTRPDHGGTA